MIQETAMSSPEDKRKHSRRRRNLQKERVRSGIAKDLLTSGKFKQRIVKDRKGREHLLDKLDHKTIVDLINEGDE